jgi:hypothetical protein
MNHPSRKSLAAPSVLEPIFTGRYAKWGMLFIGGRTEEPPRKCFDGTDGVFTSSFGDDPLS